MSFVFVALTCQGCEDMVRPETSDMGQMYRSGKVEFYRGLISVSDFRKGMGVISSAFAPVISLRYK